MLRWLIGRLRAPQMLGQPCPARAPAILAPPLCRDALPLAFRRQCGQRGQGSTLAAMKARHQAHEATPSTYSIPILRQSRDPLSISTHSPDPLMASASASPKDQTSSPSLQASSSSVPIPALALPAEPCDSHPYTEMGPLPKSNPAPAEGQSCLPGPSEANGFREDPVDTSSPDESQLPSASAPMEGMQEDRPLHSAAGPDLPSTAPEIRHPPPQHGVLSAEPGMLPPSSIGGTDETALEESAGPALSPTPTSAPLFFGYPQEILPDDDFEALEAVMLEAEARLSSRLNAETLTLRSAPGGSAQGRTLIVESASASYVQEGVSSSNCSASQTGDTSMTSAVDVSRVEAEGMRDVVSFASGRELRAGRGMEMGGSSMIVLALSATLSQVSSSSLRACSTSGTSGVVDMEDMGRGLHRLVPGMSTRSLRTSATGGAEGPLAEEEESGPLPVWAPPAAGERPLDLRMGRGLSVTDFTASEWCELQMSFKMTLGKPEPTQAMQTGSERHKVLESEVVTVEEVVVETREDAWAIRLLDSILRMRQTMREGISRELLVVCKMHGVWFVGIIDELRLLTGEDPTGTASAEEQRLPPAPGVEGGRGGQARGTVRIVDTKTRYRPTAPREGQKRNSRLQMMLYKRMMDTISETGIYAEDFCAVFGLHPTQHLSPVVTEYGSTMFPGRAITSLIDVLVAYNHTVKQMPRTDEQLLLRYEWQRDSSLLGQDLFEYEAEWLEDRLLDHLQWWKGERAPSVVDETWKCRYCPFSTVCPAVAKDASSG